MKRECACCGFLTVTEEHEVCPVCFWEEDKVQNADVLYEGGANEMNLKTARENYRKYGAVSEKYIDKVRKPKKEEEK